MPVMYRDDPTCDGGTMGAYEAAKEIGVAGAVAPQGLAHACWREDKAGVKAAVVFEPKRLANTKGEPRGRLPSDDLLDASKRPSGLLNLRLEEDCRGQRGEVKLGCRRV